MASSNEANSFSTDSPIMESSEKQIDNDVNNDGPNPEDAAVAASEEEEATVEFTSANFSIPIHNILITSQNSHGLLHHSDYAQYRSYCTRRLSRLRHAKPVRRELTHGAKSAGASLLSATTKNSSTNSLTKLGKGKGKGGGGGKSSKSRHAFYPRPEVTPQDANQHVNYILVGLYTIERSWAHAMELRATYEQLVQQSGSSSKKNKVTSSSPGSVRQHYLKRLKKTQKSIKELEGIVSKVCDETTAVEMKAYGSWMRGNWYCEIQDWKNACKEYALAFQICQALAKTTTEQNESTTSTTADDTASSTPTTSSTITAEALQRSDLFTARATNVLQPLLRYCQYELQQQSGDDTMDEDVLSKTLNNSNDEDGTEDVNVNAFLQKKLDQIKQSKLEQEANSNTASTTIAFRGHDIPVENSALRVSFLKIEDWVQEFKDMKDRKKSTKAKNVEAKFLQLLTGYDDAISIINEDLKRFADMTSGPAVNRKRFECQSLLGYCKYEKLKMLMDRSETMVNDLKKKDGGIGTNTNGHGDGGASTRKQEDDDVKYKRVEEIAHLYDALLQEARAVTVLPGGGSESGEDDEGEDEFALEANANVLRIRAFRCYYVGRMYAADTVSKYKEGIALYNQATDLASEAAEEISACQDMENADDLIQSMVDLEYEIRGSKCRAEACAVLAKLGSGASSATTGMTLLRRLDDFDSGGKTYRLADVPPSLEPIACKPMFFDIANNYASHFPLEDLQEHIQAHHQILKRSTGTGLFGKWFSRS